MQSNQIFRNDFLCIQHDLCKLQFKLLSAKLLQPLNSLKHYILHESMVLIFIAGMKFKTQVKGKVSILKNSWLKIITFAPQKEMKKCDEKFVQHEIFLWNIACLGSLYTKFNLLILNEKSYYLNNIQTFNYNENNAFLIKWIKQFLKFCWDLLNKSF